MNQEQADQVTSMMNKSLDRANEFWLAGSYLNPKGTNPTKDSVEK